MTLINTRITEFVRSNPGLDSRILRQARYGLLDAALAGSTATNSVISAKAQADFQDAVGHDYKVPVINLNTGVTISSTRAVTIADAENTSALQTITPTIAAWGFTMTPMSLYNNFIDYQRDWNSKFLAGLYSCAAAINAAVGTALNANKSQAITDYLGYTDPSTTSDVLVATSAQQENLLGDLSVMLHSDNYGFGMNYLIGNGGVESLVNQLLKYNQANEKDLRREHGDKILNFDNSIANDTGHKATGYIVEEGAVGLLTRVANEARFNMETKSGRMFTTFQLPILNRQAEYYYYDDVVDASALVGAASAHLTRTPKEFHGFSIEYAVVTPYIETIASDATPIIKFAITTA